MAQEPISSARAVEIARAALPGKVDLPADARAEVERRGERYVVTFPITLPPGVRGADYHARVTIDASSGAVLEILGGP